VCAWCKKLRDDQGYWQLLEEFLARRAGVTVTHGICPDCRAQHFANTGTDLGQQSSKN